MNNKKRIHMNLATRTSLLLLLAHNNHEVWEILHPHTPKISKGTQLVVASMIIKPIASQLSKHEIAKELHSVGARLFSEGVKIMNYDDDNWCPTPQIIHIPKGPIPDPYPDPWPIDLGAILNRSILGPHPEPWLSGSQSSPWKNESEVALNPQPLPPKAQKYYGALLTQLSDAISIEDIAVELRKIGSSLMAESLEKEKSGDDIPVSSNQTSK